MSDTTPAIPKEHQTVCRACDKVYDARDDETCSGCLMAYCPECVPYNPGTGEQFCPDCHSEVKEP